MTVEGTLPLPQSEPQAAPAPGFAVGSRVWIPDGEAAFVQGHVVALGADSLEIELEPRAEMAPDAKVHAKDVQRVENSNPGERY